MSISPKRLEEIQNIPDSAIDTSDIPELDERFWENAQMVKPITKKAISILPTSEINLAQQGINKDEARFLRESLASFAEDWDRNGMSIYDDYDTAKANLEI